MPSRRGAAAYFAYAPEFPVQAAFGSPLDLALLTNAFRARAYPTVREQTDRVLNCSGEWLVDEILTGRIGELSVDFPVTIPLLAGFYALAYGLAGAPGGVSGGFYPHALSQLGFGAYQPPPTTFVVGFYGSERAPLILQDAVVNSVSVNASAQGAGRLTATADLRFSGALPAAADFDEPVCADTVSVRMVDCALTVGGVDITAGLKSLSHSFSNNLLTNDDPFTLASVDAQRIERADERTETFNFDRLGEAGDDLWADMVARAKRSVALRIGAANAANMVISAASAVVKRNGAGKRFDGEASRTVLSATAEPIAVGGNPPSQAVATLASNERLLVIPA